MHVFVTCTFYFTSLHLLVHYPIYFVTVAAEGMAPEKATELFAWASALAMIIVAMLAPILGAIADHAGAKKRMLGGFIVFGLGRLYERLGFSQTAEDAVYFEMTWAPAES